MSTVVSVSAFAHPADVMRCWLAERRLPYPVIGRTLLNHVQRVIGARFDTIAPVPGWHDPSTHVYEQAPLVVDFLRRCPPAAALAETNAAPTILNAAPAAPTSRAAR